jgi:hypothetical protein
MRGPWPELGPIATGKKGAFKNANLISQGRRYVFVIKTSQLNVV